MLGFLGEEFFKRTSVPDPLFLLLFGVLLGPILNVFTHEQLSSITPYFAALALIVILFDGGLNMNIQQAIKNSPRAFDPWNRWFHIERCSYGVALQVHFGLAPFKWLVAWKHTRRRQFNNCNRVGTKARS